MASLRKEFRLDVPASRVWEAFRDLYEVHTRLAPGFVVDCRRDGDDRIVTFANGLVAREVIVGVDDAARRLVYSARSERLSHHNASFQIIEEMSDSGARCRVVWIADVLPHAAAGPIGAMMDAGIAAMRKALASLSDPL
jgi:hypothetical protein